ncbi:hypothetical protein [Nocardia abscessus]|uniref:hypothetical protein n=2 Tax=Nocardia abscessus TaxID=120957 RepID=UPI00397FACFD
MPLRLRRDEGELRLITTLTSFATAVDVTLAELQLEAFLPGDEQTARILRGRAARRLGESRSPLRNQRSRRSAGPAGSLSRTQTAASSRSAGASQSIR